jgi:hypothetical protein
MRNIILSAAAALVVLALPGVAAAQSGYVGAAWSTTQVDGFDDADAYGVEGAVAFEGSNSISFEIDAAISDSDDTDAAYGVTGHLFTRNSDYLFGGFVGVASSDDSTAWTAGVEANKYFSNVTLAGAIAYASDDDADVDGYGVTGQARYFVQDNFRLDATVGWASLDGGGADDDALSLGVGGEYQFAAAPISIRAGYARVSFDEADIDADTFTIGVRYNFGGTTLFDRDRSGASQADIAGIAGII